MGARAGGWPCRGGLSKFRGPKIVLSHARPGVGMNIDSQSVTHINNPITSLQLLLCFVLVFLNLLSTFAFVIIRWAVPWYARCTLSLNVASRSHLSTTCSTRHARLFRRICKNQNFFMQCRSPPDPAIIPPMLKRKPKLHAGTQDRSIGAQKPRCPCLCHTSNAVSCIYRFCHLRCS